MEARKNLITILLGLSLVACGGGGSSSSENSGSSSSDGGGGNDAGSSDSGSGSVSGINYFGVVAVEEYADDNEIEATAGFFRLSSSVDLPLIASALEPLLDECRVDEDSLDFDDIDIEVPDFDTDVVMDLVSAGEVLTLTSSAGTYLSLVKQNYAGLIGYSSEPEYVTGPLPSSLTLDVPGDAFPAFSDITMPVVETLQITSSLAEIAADAAVSWEAGSSSNAHIYLEATFYNSVNNKFNTIECVARDDGQFTFPTQMVAQAGGAPVQGFYASRDIYRVEQQGDAVLYLLSSSGE